MSNRRYKIQPSETKCEPDSCCSSEMENSDINLSDKADKDVARQLRLLTRSLDRGTFKLVMLLPRFDRLKLWRQDGHKSCIAWLNAACGMSPSAAGDRRRVGYALETLPVIRQLFELGELSWSKVRALTRIATPENERELASNALQQSASDIERMASQYRNVNTTRELEDEDAKATAQHQNRQVTYRFDEQGMVRIHALLPPVEGAAVLKSIERAEDVLFTETQGKLNEHVPDSRNTSPCKAHENAALTTARQLRADALCLMAMKHLSAENVDVRTADRYQVVVHVDADVLNQTPENPSLSRDLTSSTSSLCYIEGGPKIAASAARRLADDSSIVPLIMKHGEPLSIGRKSRVWPASVARAIMARDCQCQFPGCSATRHLHFHHLTHWADGGETSVDGGVALCGFHHRLVHEQHYKVVKTALDSSGQLPLRNINVTTSEGGTLALSAPIKRFRVQRSDGSWVE